MDATTVAVDLAKNVFQLAIADRAWRIVHTARLSRSQFARWFDNRQVGSVIMEARGSAHHWARMGTMAAQIHALRGLGREFGVAIPGSSSLGKSKKKHTRPALPDVRTDFADTNQSSLNQYQPPPRLPPSPLLPPGYPIGVVEYVKPAYCRRAGETSARRLFVSMSLSPGHTSPGASLPGERHPNYGEDSRQTRPSPVGSRQSARRGAHGT